jgi:heat shock protein HslJ
MTDVFIGYFNDGHAIAAGGLEAKGRRIWWNTKPLVPRIAAFRVGLIALAVLGLVASPADAQTSDRSWVLENGQGFKSLKDSPASLTLNDKELSGSTGCNTFRATLSERAEKRVAINDVALTRKLCAPPASDNERAIVQAFNKTEFIEEKADTLTFLSGSREALLVWKPAKQSGSSSIRAATVPPPFANLPDDDELTPFPWPPPDPSSKYVMQPNSFFAGMKTVGVVANHIVEALDQRGYTERSFYSAKKGRIILVTRLERINDDGKPVLGTTRWRSGYSQRARFKNGLVDFLGGLFYAEPGYYRIIVFVIGGGAFQTSERRATEKEAQEWLSRGMSNLPKSVQRWPFDPEEDDCTALVYEFVSEDKEREAELQAPGKLPAQSHLEASGLLAALGKHN